MQIRLHEGKMNETFSIKGRGTASQIPNRFDKNYREKDAESLINTFDDPAPQTELIADNSKTILAKNNSPDIGFTFSVNPYRGCEHGCAYCYARPTHEYLGYSAGIDFETKIVVKYDAPKLLRESLMKKSWEPQVVMMSGVTDCYQPVEKKLELTRQCLQVFSEFKNPVAMITKNHLVTRDVDILAELAKLNLAIVYLSITTLNNELCGKLEPRTSRPAYRLRAIEELAKAGVPVGVNVAPVIAGLNDSEIPAILEAAANAGATQAGFVPLRLPLAVAPIFMEWLDTHYPDRKEKILHHQAEMRGGKLNDSRFGSRMRGEGVFAENIRQVFYLFCKKYKLNEKKYTLSTEHFTRPGQQQDLFSK
jgi:DNA repair photolyase